MLRAFFHYSSVHAVHSRLLWDTVGFFRWNLSKQPSRQSIEPHELSLSLSLGLVRRLPPTPVPIFYLYSHLCDILWPPTPQVSRQGKVRFYEPLVKYRIRRVDLWYGRNYFYYSFFLAEELLRKANGSVFNDLRDTQDFVPTSLCLTPYRYITKVVTHPFPSIYSIRHLTLNVSSV